MAPDVEVTLDTSIRSICTGFQTVADSSRVTRHGSDQSVHALPRIISGPGAIGSSL